MKRNYRDVLIEHLYDANNEQMEWHRLERALLLDRLDAQRDEIARLKAQIASQRAELTRYSMRTVAGVAA